MKIAVCVSHVPDTAAKINIGADGKSIDPAGVTFVVNPYDEFAIEEALKQKKKLAVRPLQLVWAEIQIKKHSAKLWQWE